MSKIAQRAALRGKMDLGHQISHLPTHPPNECKNWRKEVATEVTTRVVTSAKDRNLGHQMLSSTKRGWRSQPDGRHARWYELVHPGHRRDHPTVSPILAPRGPEQQATPAHSLRRGFFLVQTGLVRSQKGERRRANCAENARDCCAYFREMHP